MEGISADVVIHQLTAPSTPPANRLVRTWDVGAHPGGGQSGGGRSPWHPGWAWSPTRDLLAVVAFTNAEEEAAGLVGARRPEQVAGWIDAATLELTGEDVAAIGRAILQTGVGEGPARP
ncbi:hypothetical protein [Nonomuraea sp. NPDC049400]|uniref:hypothetical protein n=1 Tax=Nonomuraea sp. NPDC049400 TaxID=3364352 RepID=UPI0037886432